MTITIELAGEPKGKGRPRFTRKGIAFTPAKTRSYETALRWMATQAMRGRQPLEGPLQVAVSAHMPIPTSWSRKRQNLAVAGDILPATKPDADNVLKQLDALNTIVWRDDAQIVSLAFTKRYSLKPRLVVTISPVVPVDIAETAAA